MISRILGWGTSLLVLLLILELGLRLVGMGPPVRITEPDATLGWSNVPGETFHRSSPEFDVDFTFNDIGLRDDPLSKQRDAGERRVLMLGDSFVLGYTVDRENHFVDLLEKQLNSSAASATSYQVVNAGVEGFGTDQEALFLARLHGEMGLVQSGDVVILCMYLNDLYWNDQASYGSAQKPLLQPTKPDDPKSAVTLAVDPPLESRRSSWFTRNSAILNLFGSAMEPPKEKVEGLGEFYAEWGFLLRDPQPAYVTAAVDRTIGILRAYREYCEKAGLRYMVALIPDKAQVNAKARTTRQGQLPQPGRWDMQRATSVLASAAKQAGIQGVQLLDPMNPAPGEKRLFEERDQPLHYLRDWHFSPLGNVRYAEVLAQRLRAAEFYPDLAPGYSIAESSKEEVGSRAPIWPWIVGGLWILLSFAFIRTYPDENKLLVPLKIGALLVSVVMIFLGIGELARALPHGLSSKIPLIMVALILLVVFWGVRKRIGTIFELFSGMIDRGHWYMVPLLTVLLAIGMLLVVAASNPFVAPFIYTLF